MATLEKDFTATGVASGLVVNNGDSFTYDVAGTFVGTVVLERSDDYGQTWATLVTATGATSGTQYIDTGRTATVRWRCSAYTSGTIETEVADAAVPTGTFGGGVITTTESGATVTGTLAVTSTITSGGVAVPTISSTSTLTNKTLTNPTVNAASGVIVVPTATVPAQTAEGSIVWDSNDDLLTVGDGSARKTMVDTAGTQTLTNKTLTSPAITTPTVTGPVTSTPAATDATLGAVAAPVSGTTAVTIDRWGPFFRLNFTLTAAQIAVTDDGANGSFGALKLFDFAEQSILILGCRQNYTAFAEGAALTGGAGDADFVIGLGSVAIAAAADKVLGATNKNIGDSTAVTLAGGTGTGTEHDYSNAGGGLDGTSTAVDIYLNWSGSAATIDANSTIDVTATITVVGVMMGDD